MDTDFGLLVDFLRGELDEGSAAEIRKRLENEEALFQRFEKLRRTYDVLRSMPALAPRQGNVSPKDTPAADIPLTEPREEFVRDLNQEFKARGLVNLIPFIEANPAFIQALQIEFFVRAVVSSIPMIAVGDSLLAALRSEFSARATVGSIPFIAAQPEWIKALREEFAVRATVGSIPMLEVRPEFAAALREEFAGRSLVSAMPALDVTDSFKRRLKVAMVEASRDVEKPEPAENKGDSKLPTVDASDPFRRRVFKQILLSSRRSVRATPTRVDASDYEWGREIKRGWKKSRRPVALTMALHAIAIGVLLFVFTNGGEGVLYEPVIAQGDVTQYVKPPEPEIGDGEYDSEDREPIGPRYIGLGDWNSRNEDLPVGIGGDPVPDSNEVHARDGTPPAPDRPVAQDGVLDSSIREDVASFFRLRADPREKKIGYLGSEELYDALDKALAYLQRSQHQDGYWGHIGVDPRIVPTDYDLRTIRRLEMTSAAVLAYLGDGHSSESSPLDYDWNVRRGIDWILLQQKESGQIGPVENGNVTIHAMATLALAEEFGMTRSHKLRDPLRNACRWLCSVKAANSDGFPCFVGQDASMTTSVWAYMALATARNVRVPPIDLPQQRIDAFLAWYSKQSKDTTALTDIPPVLAQTKLLPQSGAAALNLFAEEEAIKAGEEIGNARREYVREVNRSLPDLGLDFENMKTDRADMRYLFFGSLTQSLTLQREGKKSNEWYRRFTETLLANQQENGSYKPGSYYGGLYGDAYAAAMAALSIENAYRVSILKE